MQHASEGGLVRVGVRWGEFVPWRSFTITTTWTPEVATIELTKMVGQSSFFAGADPVTPFVGAWVGDRFRFRPRIRHSNSFAPVIEAMIAPDPRGARVHVTMRLNSFVLVFMGVWVTGATLGAIALLSAAFAGFPPGVLGPLLPIVGGYMTTAGFEAEARPAEVLLRALFPPALSGEGPVPYR
jgi:hypothetical protein